MKYARARLNEWRREEIYRNYVCDSLRASGERKYLSKRYSDIVNPKPKVSNREATKKAIDALKNSGVKIL